MGLFDVIKNSNPISAQYGFLSGSRAAQRTLGLDRFNPSGASDLPQFQAGEGSSGIAPIKEITPYDINGIVSQNPAAYTAKDFSAPLPEYDTQRQKLDTEFSNQRSTAMDALDRRFAAMGGGPSGAQVKSQLILENQLAQSHNQAANDIGFAEAQTRRGLQQQEAQKEFQSGEAYKQRGFGARIGLTEANKGIESQNAMNAFEGATKLRALDLQHFQILNQAKQDEYNKELSTYQAQHQGGLLGAGGFLGTGIG